MKLNQVKCFVIYFKPLNAAGNKPVFPMPDVKVPPTQQDRNLIS